MTGIFWHCFILQNCHPRNSFTICWTASWCLILCTIILRFLQMLNVRFFFNLGLVCPYYDQSVVTVSWHSTLIKLDRLVTERTVITSCLHQVSFYWDPIIAKLKQPVSMKSAFISHLDNKILMMVFSSVIIVFFFI